MTDFGSGDLFKGKFNEAMIMGTAVAWAAGKKLYSMLPESLTAPFSTKPKQSIEEDFYVNYSGKYLEKEEVAEATFTDFLSGKSVTREIGFTNSSMAENMFYNGNITTMWLQVQSNDTWIALPCINGFPKITMRTIPNTMPIASNLVPATTNRRIEPARFLFEFPIAYLGVYGANEEFEADIREAKDERNWLQKGLDKLTWDNNIPEKWNPIGGLSNGDIDGNVQGQRMERSIPTYDQVYSLLEQFPSQFGCYLYMGIQNRKIPCSASIEIESTKNGVDAIFVKFELIECQEFDFDKLRVTKTNVKEVSSHQKGGISNGKTTPNSTTKI